MRHTGHAGDEEQRRAPGPRGAARVELADGRAPASGSLAASGADESAAPIVRERAAHNVSRRDIDPDALKVLYHLSRNGYIAYLVGGGVRDLLLGRRPKDFDVGTNAHPKEIRRLFRNCFLIGRRFRLAHIRFGQKVIETSTFRRQPEVSATEGAELYHHRDNTFGTPAEDARRRDFTINGLFYDIRTFAVIDYVGGLEDLERRTIRSIGDPNVRFREDPVRMLRAVRFAARLGFEIEAETYAAILRHHGEIAKAAPARLLEEIYRLFAYRSGAGAFRLLRQTGLLADLFPELDGWLAAAGSDCQLFWGLLEALDRRPEAGDEPPSPGLIFGSLLYPLLLHERAARRRRGEEFHMADVERSLLRPVAERYRMPKRVFYEVLHMFDAQHRFEQPPRPAHAERWARHESFGPALALRELYVQATQGDRGLLAAWQQWRSAAERSIPLEHGWRRGEFRRGRRRRGRRRSAASAHGPVGETAGGADARTPP